MSTRQRFMRVGNELYQAPEKEFTTYLEGVKCSQSSNVKFNPNTQGFQKIGTIADFTQLSSAEAEMLLSGSDANTANEATHAQQEAMRSQ